MTDVRTQTATIEGRRQAVVVDGPDAETFLQGQLSQDISALAPGEASWSLLLQPQGKISAWFRITRVEHTRYVIDVDAGFADDVVARLNRFKLRTEVDITVPPWQCLTVIGPDADDLEIDGVEHDMLDRWIGIPVRDVFGPTPTIASVEPPVLDASEVEALRIEAGIPKMGAELDESTIPAAAGIVDRSVSFTKGCYTGQELVARIDSRGNNVPRRLQFVVFDRGEVPGVGAELRVDGAAVGTITSAAYSTRLDAPVALAYVQRSAPAGAPVSAETATGLVSGELRELGTASG